MQTFPKAAKELWSRHGTRFVSTLLPTCPCQSLVRREYLRDLRDGHGEYTPGYWVTASHYLTCAYFETYLTEYELIWQASYQCFSCLDLIIPTSPWLLLLICRWPTSFWNGFDTGLVVVEESDLQHEFEVMTRMQVSNADLICSRSTTIIRTAMNLTFILRRCLMSISPTTLWS